MGKPERFPTRFVPATNAMIEKMLRGYSDEALIEMLGMKPGYYQAHVIELARIEAISRGMLKPEPVH